MAVDGRCTPAIEHVQTRGRSTNLALKARLSTAVTHGRNARCTTMVRRTAAVRMLLNQGDPRCQAKMTGKMWGWREPRSASMYSSPSRRCPYADHPRRWLHAGLWVIPVWRQFIYHWRLLKLSAAVPDDWCCLMHTLSAASSSFSRLSVAGSEQTWCLTN